MSKLTLEEAISHYLELAEQEETQAEKIGRQFIGSAMDKRATDCRECAADHRQLAEWLMKLKEAKSIIRVCNKVLGFLLEHEIESASTRHEVETLLKNITKYLSGVSGNDT